jgi:hypothetical protein
MEVPSPTAFTSQYRCPRGVSMMAFFHGDGSMGHPSAVVVSWVIHIDHCWVADFNSF